MSAPKNHIDIKYVDNVTVVKFVDKNISGEQQIQAIGERLLSLVDNDETRKVVLDFGNVEFFSTAGLGKLITFHRELQAAGGKLVLTGVNEPTREVFEIHKLHRRFNIRKTEQDGLEELGVKPPEKRGPSSTPDDERKPGDPYTKYVRQPIHTKDGDRRL